MAADVTATPKWVLSAQIVTRGDLDSVLQGAEALDEFLLQASIRQGGEALKLPKTSRLLDQLIGDNSLNVLKAEDRQSLIDNLRRLRASAPLMKISFGNDPSPLFLQKLIIWLRQNIHRELLLTIGLQPEIGAGCTVRTVNKFYDFSLARQFAKQHGLLAEALNMGKVAVIEDPVPEVRT